MKARFVVSGKNAELLAEDGFLRVGPGVFVKQFGSAFELCMDYARNIVVTIGREDEPFLRMLDVELLEDNGDTAKVAYEVREGKATFGFIFEVYRGFIEIEETNR